jgi:hypothetical protein
MAARFGTSTGRGESDTEEEFERAKARFEKDPNAVSVMFYFKDTAPGSLSEIDPKQLGHVQEFKKKVESIGLVRLFRSRDEFARMMRMHLSQEVQNWSNRLRAGSIERELVQVEPTVDQNRKGTIGADFNRASVVNHPDLRSIVHERLKSFGGIRDGGRDAITRTQSVSRDSLPNLPRNLFAARATASLARSRGPLVSWWT